MTSPDKGVHGHPGWTGPSHDRRSYFVPDRRYYESGGLGVVYRAEVVTQRLGLQPGTPVAVKVFTGDIAQERFEKLRQRGAALSQVAHPYLAKFLEAFFGPPFVDVVADDADSNERLCAHIWVDGEPFAVRCAEAPPLDILEWGRQAAEGLDHLHNHSSGPFAHRDIHPRNIIISTEGNAVLIDFDTILVDDPVGTRTELFLPGTRFAPLDRHPGLSGAQRDDRWSLAKTVLYALARDPLGLMPLGEAATAAVTNLAGSAADPRGVVDQLLSVLDGKDPTSATALFQRLMRPIHHRRWMPRTPTRVQRSSSPSSSSPKSAHRVYKRWWFRTSVVVMAALFTAGTIRATLGAHPPSGSAAGVGTAVLAGVSCKTTNFCVGVGGKAIVFNGNSWSPSAATNSSDFLSAVSCASPRFCVAVDNVGDALSFNGNAWSMPQNIDFSRVLESISCSSTYFCVVVDGTGNVIHFNNGIWSQPQNIDSTHFVVDVSCVGRSFCIAVDDRGDALATGGGPWSAPLNIDSSNTLTGISCTGNHFCAVVDDKGGATIYTGHSWEPPRTIDASRIIEGISCVSARFCVAVDNVGNEMTFNGVSWSPPTSIDPSKTIERVSCVSARFCVAVDNMGNEMTFNHNSWSPPHKVA